MSKIVALSARKALSLKEDAVFRLLVVMTVMLGWLAGVGAGGLLGLENVYQNWQLSQKSKISVYLTANAEAADVAALHADLIALNGVDAVARLEDAEVRSLLAPYFDEASQLPLPVVIDVTATPQLNRPHFDSRVHKHFPQAEIDDARAMLEAVSRGVRFVQAGTILIALVVFVVMALLVSLTVRAGLRGLRRSLSILQYIGATDSFVTGLVTRQVTGRSLLGWVLASALAAASIGLSAWWWQDLQPYLSAQVWAGVVAAPLLLVGIAVIAAWLTTRHVVRQSI